MDRESHIAPRSALAHVVEMLATFESHSPRSAEREIAGPQGGQILVHGGAAARLMLNLCSNNYLGLADHPEVVAAAAAALQRYGFGMASVRFVCGTQTLHRELELALASFLGKDDAILFPSCFDANSGIFEALLGENDAVISDSLNHASIIDGIRLSKARRHRYAGNDLSTLEEQLRQAAGESARLKLIVTDGVFSMDGIVADLRGICDLADRYDALVMVDDCHATGHLGDGGRGTPALTGAGNRVEIVSGTLGKTLGGAMGGFIAAARPIVDLLRRKARPYLFSNSLAPAIAGGSLAALAIAEAADDRRLTLARHAKRFRSALTATGYDLLPGTTPIIPVMLGDAARAEMLASALDARGIFVAGFAYPVVPKGRARIRVQMSAALTDDQVESAIEAFADAGREIGAVDT